MTELTTNNASMIDGNIQDPNNAAVSYSAASGAGNPYLKAGQVVGANYVKRSLNRSLDNARSQISPAEAAYLKTLPEPPPQALIFDESLKSPDDGVTKLAHGVHHTLEPLSSLNGTLMTGAMAAQAVGWLGYNKLGIKALAPVRNLGNTVFHHQWFADKNELHYKNTPFAKLNNSKIQELNSEISEHGIRWNKSHQGFEIEHEGKWLNNIEFKKQATANSDKGFFGKMKVGKEADAQFNAKLTQGQKAAGFAAEEAAHGGKAVAKAAVATAENDVAAVATNITRKADVWKGRIFGGIMAIEGAIALAKTASDIKDDSDVMKIIYAYATQPSAYNAGILQGLNQNMLDNIIPHGLDRDPQFAANLSEILQRHEVLFGGNAPSDIHPDQALVEYIHHNRDREYAPVPDPRTISNQQLLDADKIAPDLMSNDMKIKLAAQYGVRAFSHVAGIGMMGLIHNPMVLPLIIGAQIGLPMLVEGIESPISDYRNLAKEIGQASQLISQNPGSQQHMDQAVNYMTQVVQQSMLMNGGSNMSQEQLYYGAYYFSRMMTMGAPVEWMYAIMHREGGAEREAFFNNALEFVQMEHEIKALVNETMNRHQVEAVVNTAPVNDIPRGGWVESNRPDGEIQAYQIPQRQPEMEVIAR